MHSWRVSSPTWSALSNANVFNLFKSSTVNISRSGGPGRVFIKSRTWLRDIFILVGIFGGVDSVVKARTVVIGNDADRRNVNMDRTFATVEMAKECRPTNANWNGCRGTNRTRLKGCTRTSLETVLSWKNIVMWSVFWEMVVFMGRCT